MLTSFKNGVPIEDLKKNSKPGLNVDMPTGFRPAAYYFFGAYIFWILLFLHNFMATLMSLHFSLFCVFFLQENIQTF